MVNSFDQLVIPDFETENVIVNDEKYERSSVDSPGKITLSDKIVNKKNEKKHKSKSNKHKSSKSKSKPSTKKSKKESKKKMKYADLDESEPEDCYSDDEEEAEEESEKQDDSSLDESSDEESDVSESIRSNSECSSEEEYEYEYETVDGSSRGVYQEHIYDQEQMSDAMGSDMGGEDVAAASVVAASIITGATMAKGRFGNTMNLLYMMGNIAAIGGIGLLLYYAWKRINDLSNKIRILEENEHLEMDNLDVKNICTSVLEEILEDGSDEVKEIPSELQNDFELFESSPISVKKGLVNKTSTFINKMDSIEEEEDVSSFSTVENVIDPFVVKTVDPVVVKTVEPVVVKTVEPVVVKTVEPVVVKTVEPVVVKTVEPVVVKTVEPVVVKTVEPVVVKTVEPVVVKTVEPVVVKTVEPAVVKTVEPTMVTKFHVSNGSVVKTVESSVVKTVKPAVAKSMVNDNPPSHPKSIVNDNLPSHVPLAAQKSIPDGIEFVYPEEKYKMLPSRGTSVKKEIIDVEKEYKSLPVQKIIVKKETVEVKENIVNPLTGDSGDRLTVDNELSKLMGALKLTETPVVKEVEPPRRTGLRANGRKW